MICLPQEYLRSGKSLLDLIDAYAIKVHRHCIYSNLVHLKYNQIESPMGDLLVQQCRGLILDEKDNWKIIAWPFNKFFNYGEGHAANIDWSTAKVQEKLDGSLVYLYWYDSNWNVATSGRADASGEVGNGYSGTFNTLFWQVWSENKLEDLYNKLNPSITYMFELTTPFNKIVVQQKEFKITCIGARANKTGDEKRVEGLVEYGLNVVKQYPLNSLQAILDTAEKLDPLQQEGFVVVDENYNRIKIKSPAYIALHHVGGGKRVTPETLVELIKTDKLDDFLVAFPEYKALTFEILGRIQYTVKQAESIYAQNQFAPTQKDFALAVKDHPLSSLMFMKRANKIDSIYRGLIDFSSNKIVEKIGL